MTDLIIPPQNSASAPAAPSATPTPDLSEYPDHASRVLASDASLSMEDRANLHDIFYSHSTPEALSQHLSALGIHPESDLHQNLLAAQAKNWKPPFAPPTPLDKVVSAINALKRMDPQTRTIGESHPTVMRILVDAATKD